MTPTRIIVTGDIFRPNKAADENSQEINIRWMKGLFQPCLEQATGLPVTLVTVADLAGSLPALYAGLGQDPTVDSWAALYQALPDALTDRLKALFADSFVVGFELPPSLLALLEDMGVPYVDVVLHPVRYMQDLLLGFDSNVPAIAERLQAHCMSEVRARTATGVMRAFAARFRLPQVPPASVLFIGQMSQDRSMISDGRFLRPEDYMEGLIARVRALSSHGTVLVKLHPLERNLAVLEALRGAKFDIVETDEQVYALLSSGLVSSVVSVSSSVGEEARFFGLEAEYGLALSTPVRYRESPADQPGHISIYDDFLATDFWREVLAPVLPVTAPDGLAPEGAPNLLRTTLRTYWGYEDFAFDGPIRMSRKWAGTHGAEKIALPILRGLEQATLRTRRRLLDLIGR